MNTERILDEINNLDTVDTAEEAVKPDVAVQPVADEVAPKLDENVDLSADERNLLCKFDEKKLLAYLINSVSDKEEITTDMVKKVADHSTAYVDNLLEGSRDSDLKNIRNKLILRHSKKTLDSLEEETANLKINEEKKAVQRLSYVVDIFGKIMPGEDKLEAEKWYSGATGLSIEDINSMSDNAYYNKVLMGYKNRGHQHSRQPVEDDEQPPQIDENDAFTVLLYKKWERERNERLKNKSH